MAAGRLGERPPVGNTGALPPRDLTIWSSARPAPPMRQPSSPRTTVANVEPATRSGWCSRLQQRSWPWLPPEHPLSGVHPATSSQTSAIDHWRSTDGENWTNKGTLPGSAGVLYGLRFAVTNGPLGWVAVASAKSDHKKAVAWSSAARDHLQVAPDPPFGSIENIFADDVGFIAVGLVPGRHRLRRRCGQHSGPDALRAWTARFGGGCQIGLGRQDHRRLRRDGRTLNRDGIDFSQNDAGLGAAWTAKLPDAASGAGPVPTNPPTPGNGCGSAN